MKPPVCPYCGDVAEFTDSGVVYGRSYGDLWLCKNYPVCDSYVGTHKETGEALGSMANKELRNWRKQAHSEFDVIWRKGHLSRKGAYKWMMSALKIDESEAHIGMFDVDRCKALIEALVKQRPDRHNIKSTQIRR